MHHHTKSSKKLKELREEPQVDIDLPSGGPLRKMIFKFHIPSTRNNPKGGNIQTVYYLFGDERRAVRKFIKINDEFINEMMKLGKDSCVYKQFIGNDMLLQIFEQEYEIMKHKGEI